MQKALRVAYTQLTHEEYTRLVEWLGERTFTFEHEDDWVVVLDITPEDMSTMEDVLAG
jgi:hypothetical protein